MKHFLMCLLYIAALGVLSFVVGRLIPKHWFHADRFPWVCHPAEQKLWKRLHVRKWQAKIPDMSRIFVKIMPEKKLTKENYENLPRMIEETCVAEWTHILLSIAGLGLLKIWSGVGGVCVIGSVAAMFGLWDCKALQSVGWKIAATSIAVCISLSTVFMKQHSIMDVLAALPVCFFGWWIAYKILPNNKTNRFLTRM